MCDCFLIGGVFRKTNKQHVVLYNLAIIKVHKLDNWPTVFNISNFLLTYEIIVLTMNTKPSLVIIFVAFE